MHSVPLPAPRVAGRDDIPALEALIRLSARALSQGHYEEVQIDAAITYVFGVDSELVADRTYLMIEEAGVPIGCGGWSRRRTLFGGDRFGGRDDAMLDPSRDAARIRAFFVHPDHARRGVGAALLAASEAAAIAAGFGALELMSTLPGVAFYRRAGFVPGEQILHRAGGVAIPFVPMRKRIG
ncbi:GNAT family N-acetyltransferase [Sphingomonas sp. M1-B02]|uniref:GNAT family N-acetyltransferase n=1 Tax=Sphingomonas sp. M1-B02 TaxID=3114300 RepID=UPI00223F6616|nr:GNAT family N-acetyltransferase [Sphingomonas sp. S6-11]UZK67341.1 GNAT family N-acetyltransferase [Sphingomonas sp. S6-11]